MNSNRKHNSLLNSNENGINYDSEIKQHNNFLRSKRKSNVSDNKNHMSQLSIN